MVLKPWNERKKTRDAVLQRAVQQQIGSIAGSQSALFQPPSLPGARGLPVQFVITTTEPFAKLYDVSQQFLQDALKSGQFIFLQSDLRIDLPQTSIEIDRDMAAQLGLTMQDVGNALSAMLGGGYVNFFELAGRSYKVIPQVEQRFRLNPDQLRHYYLRSRQRRHGAAVHRGAPDEHRAAGDDQPLPAAQLRDDPGRAVAVRRPGNGAARI